MKRVLLLDQRLAQPAVGTHILFGYLKSTCNLCSYSGINRIKGTLCETWGFFVRLFAFLLFNSVAGIFTDQCLKHEPHSHGTSFMFIAGGFANVCLFVYLFCYQQM